MLSIRPSSSADLTTPLRCEVTPDRDVVTVAVDGELDIATAPVLDAQLRELRDVGFQRVVVDLRGLAFMDSTGAHLLLRWTAADGQDLRVVLGSRARAVFVLTGTLDALQLQSPGPDGAP